MKKETEDLTYYREKLLDTLSKKELIKCIKELIYVLSRNNLLYKVEFEIRGEDKK